MGVNSENEPIVKDHNDSSEAATMANYPAFLLLSCADPTS